MVSKKLSILCLISSAVFAQSYLNWPTNVLPKTDKTQPAQIRLLDLTQPNANYIGFTVPSNVQQNMLYILNLTADGNTGQCLGHIGFMQIGWVACAGGGGGGGTVQQVSSTSPITIGGTTALPVVGCPTCATFPLTTNSFLLKGNNAGGITNASGGTDYEFPLAFSAPLSRSVNAISLPVATNAANGYLSFTDWSTFNGKENVITFSPPLSRVSNTVSVPAATNAVDGFLSATDWTAFNAKEHILTFSPPLSRSVNAISMPAASGSVNGYLSSTDWTTFNNKLSSSGLFYQRVKVGSTVFTQRAGLSFDPTFVGLDDAGGGYTNIGLAVTQTFDTVTANLSFVAGNMAGGGVQCVQVNNAGALSGTGAGCGGGGGTGANALGFYFVSKATNAPANAINLGTTLTTGLVKASVSGSVATLSTAVSGTDFLATTPGTNGQALTSNGAGGFGTPVTLATIATSGSASDLGSGTVNAARLPSGLDKFISSGPTVARTFTFPDANATIAYNTGSPSFNGLTATGLAGGGTQCVHVSNTGAFSGTGSDCGAGGGGANANGFYLVTQTTNAPVNAVNVGALTTGLLKISVSGGVATPSTAVSGTDYLVGTVTVPQGGTGNTTLPANAFILGNGASATSSLSDTTNQGKIIAFKLNAAPVSINPLAVNATLFDFPTQTPGGSLIIGNNSVTMTPVPAGVNHGDTHHWMYVSGGVGTAESCLINGGTGNSGDASGVIQIQCANTHSGAWTIKSGTAGAREACIFGGTSCSIYFPAGTFTFYSTMFAGDDAHTDANTRITGAGIGVTTLSFSNATDKMFDFERNFTYLENLHLTSAVTGTSSIAVYIAGAASGVTGPCTWQARAQACLNDGKISNLIIDGGFWNGIKNDGDGGSVDLEHIGINGSRSHALISNAAQGYWHDIVIVTVGVSNAVAAHGVVNAPCAFGSLCGASPFIEGLQVFDVTGNSVYSTFPLQITGNSFLNNSYLGEVYMSFPGNADNAYITDTWLQFSGHTYTWGDNPTPVPLLYVASSSGPMTFSNLHMLGNGNSGATGNLLDINNGTNQINQIYAQGANASNYAIKVTGGANMITSSYFGGPAYFYGGDVLISGNRFNTQSNSLPAIYFPNSGFNTNNVVAGNAIAQAGSAAAFLADAGTTFINLDTNKFVGTRTLNGALVGQTQLASKNVSTLGTCGIANAGTTVWAVDALIGSQPCSGASTGGLAVCNGGNARWECK